MFKNALIIFAIAGFLSSAATAAFGQQAEERQTGYDKKQELRELLSWIKVLGTFKRPIPQRGDAVLLTSGCTIKQTYGNFEALFNLSDMDPDAVELQKGTFANEEITVLHTRGFAKVVTHTTSGVSDDLCKARNICNGVEYSDRAIIWSNSPQGGAKMKKFLIRAIELCTP